jgi:hypothetical protein
VISITHRGNDALMDLLCATGLPYMTKDGRMNLAVKLRVAACLSIGLLATGAACAQGLGTAKAPALRDQIAQHEQKLAQARAANQSRDEATELNALASLYRQTGKTQMALDDCTQALQIEQSAGNRIGVAQT